MYAFIQRLAFDENINITQINTHTIKHTHTLYQLHYISNQKSTSKSDQREITEQNYNSIDAASLYCLEYLVGVINMQVGKKKLNNQRKAVIVTVDCGSYKLYLCVCLSVCLPRFYISLTVGQILIKLVENVITSVRMIVLKFHKNWISFDVIMTSFLFSKVISKGSNSPQSEKTLCKGKQKLCCARSTHCEDFRRLLKSSFQSSLLLTDDRSNIC